MKWIWISAALAFGSGFMCGIIYQESIDSPGPSYACLPEDKCIMHIVPFGKPWLALTCDLQTNKCWDDPPLPPDACVSRTYGPNSGGVECHLEIKP